MADAARTTGDRAGSRSPLSGDVIQDILPWTFWFRFFTSQMGFINIQNMNSGDSALEQEIVGNVASYGRQLGRINDVLSVLISRLNNQDLTEGDRAAVKDFREMAARIALAKRGWGSPEDFLTGLEALLDSLDELKAESPKDYDKAMRRIRDAAGPRAVAGTRAAAKA